MAYNDIYELYQTMERENILLSFKGVVTSELLTSVLSIMESKMDYMEESPKTKKKVFNVLVECLQNLYHHIDVEESERNFEKIEAKSALFMISKKDDHFIIQTGNYIDSAGADDLRLRLDLINGMDKDELKKYYQETLGNGAMSVKGTAGLGMIDIARKSGNKLDYQFLPINDKHSFFCLNIKVD